MSIQYQDNTFSPNMDFESALEKFQNEVCRIDNPAKALFVGTEEELEEIKGEKTLGFRVGELEEMMETLKPEKESESILKPTKEQIEHVMNEFK